MKMITKIRRERLHKYWRLINSSNFNFPALIDQPTTFIWVSIVNSFRNFGR